MSAESTRRVTQVVYTGGLSYQATFDDGVSGEVHFLDFILLGTLYRLLEDATYFPQARVRDGAMVWPGGFTIHADALYANIMWHRGS
jgi:hypothetical protein